MPLLFSSILSSVLLFSALIPSPCEDQYGNAVDWGKFSHKPFVLVLADRSSASSSRSIGAALHAHFNGNWIAGKTSLQTDDVRDRVKIIPVAELPHVPDLAKWLFQKGFQLGASDLGVILDYDGALGSEVKYSHGILLVLRLPNKDTVLQHQTSEATDAIDWVSRSVSSVQAAK